MYVTKQGECWDEAAKNVYGNEKYAGYLMQHNLHLLDIAVFSEGTVLEIPALPAEESDLPAWRKQV